MGNAAGADLDRREGLPGNAGRDNYQLNRLGRQLSLIHFFGLPALGRVCVLLTNDDCVSRAACFGFVSRRPTARARGCCTRMWRRSQTMATAARPWRL